MIRTLASGPDISISPSIHNEITHHDYMYISPIGCDNVLVCCEIRVPCDVYAIKFVGTSKDL